MNWKELGKLFNNLLDKRYLSLILHSTMLFLGSTTAVIGVGSMVIMTKLLIETPSDYEYFTGKYGPPVLGFITIGLAAALYAYKNLVDLSNK